MGHIVGFPGIRSREAFKELFASFFAAFDELHRANEFLIAEGDKVVAYDTYRIKQTGEFAGIPPTDREVTFTGIDIYRIVGGRIVEQWYEMDITGMLQQLREGLNH